MKKLLILLIFILPSYISYAQDDYYWYRGQKISLTKIETKKYIVFEESIKSEKDLKDTLSDSKIKILKVSENNFTSKVADSVKTKWAIIESDSFKNEKFTDKRKIIYEAPYYKTGKNEVGLSHLFYVKLKDTSDFYKLDSFAKQNKVVILWQNKFMKLWFTLSCSKESEGNALEMANLFFETNLFAEANPDLMMERPETCVNDNLFSNQWGLKSTGQHGGSVDIKVCDAWNVTHGSNNVILALIDETIKLGHTDLTNISEDTYGTPFNKLDDWDKSHSFHGIQVAGIMSANSDNLLGIAGIADKCPLIATSYIAGSPNFFEEVANGINFAWQNGASVINGSVTSTYSTLIYDAIIGGLTDGRNGLGCVMVFAAGNYGYNYVDFPSSADPDVISVGMIAPCGTRLVEGQCGVSWDTDGSQYGVNLDIMGPGYHIPTTSMTITYGFDYNMDFEGTSAAAPHVAAIAALILSVNPYLTQDQVRDIIESTAQKIGGYNYQTASGRSNGTWHEEMGYGLIDADSAVRKALSMCTTGTYDLYSKDNNNDIGLEPNPANAYNLSRNPYMHMSDDIWVRNQNDGFINQIHQNPEFTLNQPIYVYVKVRNKGCEASGGIDELKVYWAKAGTGLTWPYPWDGSSNSAGQAPYGNLIDVQTIGSIESGGYEIFEFEWYPPNPNLYTSWYGGQNGHFCLLARIEEDKSQDGMFKVEDNDLVDNVKQNNNIVWKNIMIFDIEPGYVQPKKGCIIVTNFLDETNPLGLTMAVPGVEADNSAFDHGTVQLDLSPSLYSAWVSGGSIGGDGIIVNDNIITFVNPGAWIGNIILPIDTPRIACMIFTPTDSSAEVQDTKYNLDLLQTDSSGDIMGGERFAINFTADPPEEIPFKANTNNLKAKEPRINIFPNPTKNNFTVDIDSKELCNVRVIDILGREKFKGPFSESTTIITSMFPRGLYFVVVTNNNFQFVKKLILE
jgi:subtilisin family serine protease